MPHNNDKCFVCKQSFEVHKKGSKCKSFEFVAYSSRNEKDITFSVPFQSESSAKVHTVLSWKQGDYSCNCTGFRNYRKCKHVEEVSTNPTKFRGKALQVQGSKGAAGIAGEVGILQSEIEELERAVSQGREADISSLAAKIELKKMQLEAAGVGLAARYEKMQSTIRETMKRDLGLAEDKPVEVTRKAPEATVANVDDPFGDL